MNETRMYFQINAYKDLNQVLWLHFVIDSVNSLKHGTDVREKGKKIGLAPANDLAKLVLECLAPEFKDSIVVFDKNTAREFPVRIHDYSELEKDSFHSFFIVSPFFKDAIMETVRSKGMPHEAIFATPLHESIPNVLPVEDFLHGFTNDFFQKKCSGNIGILESLLKGKQAIILYSSFFHDVHEKIRIFREDMGYEVIFIDNVLVPEFDKQEGVVRTNLIDIMNYLKRCDDLSPYLFFIVHNNLYFVLPYVIRQAFPTIRIISYVYDWLNLFCPYPHRELFRKHLRWDARYLESEYRMVEEIRKGEVVDGVIHKDGGNDFALLRDCKVPTLFFPTYMRRDSYQKQSKDVDIPHKLVFIGSIYSNSVDVPELFSDVSLFGLFDRIIGQGFCLDVYYARSPEMVAQEYREYFIGKGNIRFIEGKKLDFLLPEIAEEYHWGYMLYDDDFHVHRKHIENTLPSKVLTYLSLGVPILISAEFSFCARFILEHGVGIAVSRNELGNLKELVSRHDYRQLQRNVERFRERFSLDEHKREFIDFIREIVSGRTDWNSYS